MKFNPGDYFFYIAKSVHEDYGVRTMLGQIIDVTIEEKHNTHLVGTMDGPIEVSMGVNKMIKIYYNVIYECPAFKTEHSRRDFFTANSPMAEHSTICSKEEIDFMRLFYE